MVLRQHSTLIANYTQGLGAMKSTCILETQKFRVKVVDMKEIQSFKVLKMIQDLQFERFAAR